MAEYILLSIILATWVILGRTLFGRDSALRKMVRRRAASAQNHEIQPEAEPEDADSTGEFALFDPRFCCRMDIAPASLNDGGTQALAVSMCGRICVPAPMHDIQVQVLLADITEGCEAAQPVLCAAKQWQLDGSPAFCYKASNGRIPTTEYVLSDWTPVVTIPIDLLRFPRRGMRTLQCITSLFSESTGDELTCATTSVEYRNPDLGYIDARENAEHAEILTVQLAVAVCGATTAPEAPALTVIEQWIDAREASPPEDHEVQRCRRLAALLGEAVDTCKSGRKLDIERICSTLRSVATIVDIYDAMKLCLKTISAAGTADRAQTALIRRIAQALQVDEKRFRAMSQKILPVGLHKEKDLEFILGITADMDPEEGRQRLRDEYQKWNARVTHPDPAIQGQADQMLALIADARDRLFEGVAASPS
ncbi:MAG: J domain-containing protein [Phycisphaerae bacterium]|nr:J domain-containing protein [Phycisphaerae bacterium]